MKRKLYTLLTAITLFGLFSCKTAQKMYQKGAYDEAVQLAAKKLQKDPDNPEQLTLLQNAYAYAVSDHENRIRSHAAGTNELKWEWIYNEYASLQRLYDAIFRVPGVFGIVKPADYSGQMADHAALAGQVRVERGIAFMQRYDKQSYRNAYREFQAALRFLPGDSKTMLHLNEAFEYAATNVVVMPVVSSTGLTHIAYSHSPADLDDRLIRNLRQNPGNEFLRFFTAPEAVTRNIRTDLVVNLQPIRADIGRFTEYRDQRKVSKEIVIREKQIRTDSVVKEYGRVQAIIHNTRQTLTSEMIMQVHITDLNGFPVWREDMAVNHAWSTEFHSFTGDIRALSESDMQLVERRREYPPSESSILEYLVNKLSQDASWKLRSQFSRY
ncbi:MAG: hypothetical protein ACO25B_12400 [Chitinophagaceae bacterium]